jgi:hypothetical protein
MALTICGSCKSCYGETLPACTHCSKTLHQQIEEGLASVREIKAEQKGYERGVKDGTTLTTRIYNYIFIR